MKIHVSLLVFFSLYCSFAWGEDSIPIRFLEQLNIYPQEKIFVHTDKPNYAFGDTIWLRAHLVDAATHIPSPVSRYVYVELVSSSDSIIERIKIRMNDSIYRGQIPIPQVIPQGFYTLRAYTGFMKSLNEDYLFKTNLSITSPFAGEPKQDNPVSSQDTLLQTSSSNKPLYDVTFLPEGGYLPANIPWRVAFKAICNDGWSETISGEIVDEETDELVATLPTPYLGMGYVTFIPKEGKQYIARCTNSKNRFAKFKLPKVVTNVQALAANWRKGTLIISFTQPITQPLHLVMQSRGIVFYSDTLKPTQKALTFDARTMPAGVVQILLVDENSNPISERLVFNKYLGDIQTELITDQKEYGTRQPVKVEATLADEEGKPINGNFSVSVTDDSSVNTDNASSILSYLLLTSELKGSIEFPEAYFDPDRKRADADLDILMMTQGWRRYDVAKVLKKEYEHPTAQLEQCQEITGKVLDEINLKPKPNCPISLLSLKHKFSDETRTDSTGHFRFTRFEFPDSTSYIVKGVNKRGGEYNILLQINRESFFPFSKSKSIADLYKRKEIAEEYNVDTLSEKGIQMIQLDEVVVKAKAVEKKGKSMYHSFTGNVFSSEDFMNPRPNNMVDLLARLPGIMVAGGQVTVRGSVPLILLDDMEFDFEVIKDLQPDDIEEVELMKDASIAIFGSRGAGGVILITTKSGDVNKVIVKPNVATIHPLGYQKPIEFYSPKYTPDQPFSLKATDKRTTLYWNPCVSLSEQGKANFEFCTTDKQASYTIIMQGLTPDGRIIYKKSKINEAVLSQPSF